MEGMKLVVGIIAAALIIWLVLDGIGSYLQFGMTFGWWLIGPAAIIVILWSVVYTAFWGSSND